MTALSVLFLLASVSSTKPNFVFMFLDDLRLDDMIALPRIRDHITDRGVNVSNCKCS